MPLPHDCVTAKWLSENMHNQHSIVLIDVRSKEEYAAMHIPSAINIPIEDLINEAILFNKENQYIIICGKGGGRSADAATALKKLGYAAAWLCNGTLGWYSL